MLVSGFKSLRFQVIIAKVIIQRRPKDELIQIFKLTGATWFALFLHCLLCLPEEPQTANLGLVWIQTYCFLSQNPNKVFQGQLTLQKRTTLWELHFSIHNTVGCIGMWRRRDRRQSGLDSRLPWCSCILDREMPQRLSFPLWYCPWHCL